MAAALSIVGSAVSAASVNLTVLAFDDWAFWGTGATAAPTYRKATGGSTIGSASAPGGAISQFDGGPRTISWSDGTPGNASTDTTSYSTVGGVTSAIRMTVPATTSRRQVTVYTGWYNGNVHRVTATLSDGSASPVSVTLNGVNDGNDAAGWATIEYEAGSTGQTLQIDLTFDSVFGGDAGIQFQAIAWKAVSGGGGDVTLALTGVESTAAVGSLGVDRSDDLSGVAATGSVGTVASSRTKALTGVSSTGGVGTLAKTRDSGLSGVEATGQVGNVTVDSGSPDVTVALTGVEAVGSVGNVAFASADVVVALTGVQAVGQVGSVTAVGGDSPEPPAPGSGAGFEMGAGRRIAERNFKPLLQRVLDARYKRVKPAKERAAKRAKAIEVEAAQLIVDDGQAQARFDELMRQWAAEGIVVPAGIDLQRLFEAQVGFRLRQLALDNLARAALAERRARDEEDSLMALLLA